MELYGADAEVRDYSGRKARQYFAQQQQDVLAEKQHQNPTTHHHHLTTVEESTDEFEPSSTDGAAPTATNFVRKAPARSSSFFRWVYNY